MRNSRLRTPDAASEKTARNIQEGPGKLFPAGQDYEHFMGRWSYLVARKFVHWLRVPADGRWLDVGCGTGSISRAILESCTPAEVWGVDPDAELLHFAKQALSGTRFRGVLGHAQSLPDEGRCFNATVSGLVLNLVPDASSALIEMIRVSCPGGVVGAYFWDFAQGLEFVRYFWDTAALYDPMAADHDHGRTFPLCHPERVRALFEGSGLAGVEHTEFSVPTVFRDFEDYWNSLSSGTGKFPSYLNNLTGETRRKLRQSLQQELPVEKGGEIRLDARAWAARGVVSA